MEPGVFLKKMLNKIPLLFGLVVLGFLFYWFGFSKIVEASTIQNPQLIPVFLIISFLCFAGYTKRWKIILNGHGKDLPFKKLFFYKISGFAVSYMTPLSKLGGEPVRGYFLRKNKIPLEDTISSIFIDKGMGILNTIIFGVLGIVAIFFMFLIPSNLFLFFVSTLVVFVFLILLFISGVYAKKGILSSFIKIPGIKKISFVRKHIHIMKKSDEKLFQFFNKNKKKFLLSFMLSLGVWLLSVIEFMVLLHIFGVEISLLHSFLVLVVIGLAFMVPIPLGIGSLEGGQALLFGLIGLGASYGLVVGLIIRVRDLLWSFLGFIYLDIKGMSIKKLKNL